MTTLILALLSLMLFGFASHRFMKSVSEPMDWMRTQHFSRRALKIERIYKMFAWGLLSLILLYSSFSSFLETLFMDF